MFSYRKSVGRIVAMSVVVIMVLSGAAAAQEAAAPEEGAEAPALDVPALLQQGEEALQQKQYDQAVDAFSKVIAAAAANPQLYQSLPQAYTGRARAFVALKEYEAARADFDEVLTANPWSDENYVPALVALGQMYLDINDPAQALANFDRAAKVERANPDVLFGLGKSYVMLGAQYLPQAVKPLTKVIEAQPDNAEAHRLRGTAYGAMFKAEKAYADLNEAIRLNPEDYEAYYTLAMIQRQQKQYAEAIKNADLSISHFVPEEDAELQFYIAGYRLKADLGIELGNSLEEGAAQREAYQESLDTCDKTLELLGESPLLAQWRSMMLYSRGVALRMLGELNKAIETFSEALDLNPDFGDAYFRRGICYQVLGEEKLAAADFAQAAIIAYDDPRPRLWAGIAHAEMHDYYAALASYSQAIAISDRYTLAYVNRGLTYMMLGEWEKAVDNFNAAIRVEPLKPTHWFNRGVAYQQLAEHQKAADSFARAIELDNQFVDAYQHMAAAIDSLGYPDLAAQYRQKANELSGQQPGAM
jgi:tetratricopeptide (TPR) repeat protein